MGKRGPKKGSKSRKKQKNDSTTTTTKETPVKKSILWASSDGVNCQKLYIDKIISTDVDKALSLIHI